MTSSLLGDAFAHHVWATERLIDACAELTPEQLRTPVAGTYGSITETLHHLVESDGGYLAHVSRQSHTPIDENAGLAELRSAITRHGRAWSEFLAGSVDPDQDLLERSEDGSETWAIALGIHLAQAIHHGTDHRSQVCTALTSLGIEPPDIDVWAFAGVAGRARVVSDQEPAERS
jgi:uncharacterized damage-inducible protein DinB